MSKGAFSGAFLGGLLGSNRTFTRAVGRYAKRILLALLLAPALLLMRLGLPPEAAVRLDGLFWGLVLLWLLVRKLAPWVGQHTAGRSLPRAFASGRLCWVYWLFDEHGLFLYVGIAYNVERRMAQHACDPGEAHWWWRVDASRTVTRKYGSREEAKQVETEYIKGLRDLPRPLMNRAENTDPARGA